MRVEQYLDQNGKLSDKSHVIYATPREIVGQALLASVKIPPQFFLGSALHETSYAVNEVDTEISGYVSKGIYQLSDEEAVLAGYPGANLCDLAMATKVFAKLQEMRLEQILRVAQIGYYQADVWAYLALAHNQGLAAALKTIKAYTLNWAKYKYRNANMAICKYGDDCISGGPQWRPFLASLGVVVN